MADSVVDQKAALSGVLNAQTIALRATAQDMMAAHAVSVANDALESAAALVEHPGLASPPEANIDIANAIRGLKQ